AFGNHLGPIFIQLNDRFSPKRKDELFGFLRSLPAELQFFVEVRHPNWFAKQDALEGLLTTLREMNMGIVITDTARRRHCAHMSLTIPKTFIRYAGNDLHKTDYMRIDDWVGRLKLWLDQGVKEVYFFIHMHDEARSPELTVYLIDKLNQVGGLNLQGAKFIK